MSHHNFAPDHDTQLNRVMLDALRALLGLQPLYIEPPTECVFSRLQNAAHEANIERTPHGRR